MKNAKWIRRTKGAVVFVNPPANKEEQCSEFSPIAGFDPPYGLCYMASVVRKAGYKPYIIDAYILMYDVDKTVRDVLKQKPDYICVTATVFSINSAIRLAKALRKKTKIKLIIGGSQFSAMPRETIKYFDIGVYGEGERTLLELLDALDKKKLLKGINGVVYKSKGRIIINEPRQLIKNLDELPKPAFDLIPYIPQYYQLPVQSMTKYPSMSLVSSRGCYGQCTFCDRRIFGNRLRAHSAQYLFEIIKDLVGKYGFKAIMFHDDNFLVFKKRNLELLKLLKKSGIKLRINCLARVDMIVADNSKKYLEELKKGGLWQINIGIESGSQKILDFFKKNITLKEIEEAVNILDTIGIRCKGFFMLGNPLETKKTLEQTRSLIKKLKITDIGVTYFTPLPGSEIFPFIEKYGKVSYDFDKYNFFEVVFLPKGLKKNDLNYYYRLVYKEFYLRPRIIFDYIKRIDNPKQAIYLLKGLDVFSKHIFRK